MFHGRDTKYVIESDSQYVIECITEYAEKWEQGGWRTFRSTPVKKKDLIEGIWNMYGFITETRDVEIQFEYAPGHAKHIGNEIADWMAVAAAH